MKTTDPEYRGSPYNLYIEWETGEKTYEPLHIIAQDDPVTVAQYAKLQGLLDTKGWKRFKRIAKREKVLQREINQSKLRQVRRRTKVKFGYEVAQDFADAKRLDEQNGNTLFMDATKLEMSQIKDYTVFEKGPKAIYAGTKKPVNAPAGYQYARVHLIYDVKHDGRHKARLVLDGHLTEIPVEAV